MLKVATEKEKKSTKKHQALKSVIILQHKKEMQFLFDSLEEKIKQLVAIKLFFFLCTDSKGIFVSSRWLKILGGGFQKKLFWLDFESSMEKESHVYLIASFYQRFCPL